METSTTEPALMVILAALIAMQTLSEYKVMLRGALSVGVTPVEVKEIVYQAVRYCGIASVFDFIHATNEILESSGVKLPLEGQSHDFSRNTPGERTGAAEGDLRRDDRPHEQRGAGEPDALQQVSLRQLLRRLLHQNGTRHTNARAPDICNDPLTGRMRAPAERAHSGQCQCRKREGHPALKAAVENCTPEAAGWIDRGGRKVDRPSAFGSGGSP